MDMETKIGTVIREEKSRLLVRLEVAGKGGRCGESCECTAPAKDAIKGPRLWVENTSPSEFQIGDRVEIEAQLPSVFVAFALFFSLPTGGLLAGVMMGMAVAKHYGLLAHQIPIAASMALAGFLLAMIPASLVDHGYRKKQIFRLLGKKVCAKKKLEAGLR